MTYATTKPFSQSTYYSQRSSTTGYCGYNSYVYPPYQQKYHQTAPTNVTLSTSYLYSAPITTTRALPLTTTPTLHPVLLLCCQFFSYPNYTFDIYFFGQLHGEVHNEFYCSLPCLIPLQFPQSLCPTGQQ